MPKTRLQRLKLHAQLSEKKNRATCIGKQGHTRTTARQAPYPTLLPFHSLSTNQTQVPLSFRIRYRLNKLARSHSIAYPSSHPGSSTWASASAHQSPHSRPHFLPCPICLHERTPPSALEPDGRHMDPLFASARPPAIRQLGSKSDPPLSLLF